VIDVLEGRVMRRLARVLLALLCCGAPGLMAGVVLQPTPAPELEVSAWLNEDPGSLRDHRGRVVLIEFVQLRCPGSTRFLIPLFQRWEALYGDRGGVVFISVHSVFEDPESQTPRHLAQFVRENGIRHPVGIDGYDDTDDRIPVTMRRYRAGGTPHVAIIDREGRLRFSHFGVFDPSPVEAFIERLLDELPWSIGQPSGTTPRRPRPRSARDAKLSGDYVFQIIQATGVCAGWVPRMEIPAELRVRGDRIDVEFKKPLLGMDDLEIRYDSTSGRVVGMAQPPAPVGRGPVASQLRFDGVLDAQAEPPLLEFEFSMHEGRCAIQGRARVADRDDAQQRRQE